MINFLSLNYIKVIGHNVHFWKSILLSAFVCGWSRFLQQSFLSTIRFFLPLSTLNLLASSFNFFLQNFTAKLFKAIWLVSVPWRLRYQKFGTYTKTLLGDGRNVWQTESSFCSFRNDIKGECQTLFSYLFLFIPLSWRKLFLLPWFLAFLLLLTKDRLKPWCQTVTDWEFQHCEEN